MIRRCLAAMKGGQCQSEFQDERYGVGLRVHTEHTSKTPTCTVCGRENTGPTPKKATVKKEGDGKKKKGKKKQPK